MQANRDVTRRTGERETPGHMPTLGCPQNTLTLNEMGGHGVQGILGNSESFGLHDGSSMSTGMFNDDDDMYSEVEQILAYWDLPQNNICTREPPMKQETTTWTHTSENVGQVKTEWQLLNPSEINVEKDNHLKSGKEFVKTELKPDSYAVNSKVEQCIFEQNHKKTEPHLFQSELLDVKYEDPVWAFRNLQTQFKTSNIDHHCNEGKRKLESCPENTEQCSNKKHLKPKSLHGNPVWAFEWMEIDRGRKPDTSHVKSGNAQTTDELLQNVGTKKPINAKSKSHTTTGKPVYYDGHIHTPTKAEIAQVLNCHLCGQTVHSHIQEGEEPGDKTVLNGKRTPNINQRWKCCKCKTVFTSDGRFLFHLHKHRTRKIEKKKCPECDSEFDTYDQLGKHREVHVQGTPFACKECHKAFRTKYKLKGHMKRCHEHREACEECGQRFGLKAHVSTHICPFECSVCKSKFRSREKLSVHQFHFHTGEKPFACPQCPSRFRASRYLIGHMRRHTAAKSTACKRPGKNKSGRKQVSSDSESSDSDSESSDSESSDSDSDSDSVTDASDTD
ncbi:hypothetical protein AAFF_G00127610 [Aldrovandia affinis]|uniref:C2H2-type domain-containing protein n=1 Tax=Aldrovandia affinis TaxID=143900 RepID=A0AAD7WXA3_9TELE|nr:hypothetical protein AAFF_G00127610 [Aldrovandia affinis]